MGWTVTHKTPGTSVRAFFEDEFHSDWPDGRIGRVIDCAAFLHEAYVAFEVTYPDGRRKEVSAIVCLLKQGQSAYYNNFGYKDMSEDMGPIASNCPERILNLLTPTDNKYALSWRKRCRDNIERRRGRVPLRKGVVIRFGERLAFPGAGYEDTFRVLDAKKLVFSDVSGTRRFKLTKHVLHDEPWQVVNL